MRKYTFADEAGNFDFSRGRDATKYFVLCTVTMDDCSIGDRLIALRREIGWDRMVPDRALHASEDIAEVRRRVFDLIEKADGLRIDATILRKSKAQPHLRVTEERFYQYAWLYHLNYVAPRIVTHGDELLIAAASVGTNKKSRLFRGAVEDVAKQVAKQPYRVTFWPASSDPCLQIADYCTWAIYRRWEANESETWRLIKPKIQSEFNLFAAGTKEYY